MTYTIRKSDGTVVEVEDASAIWGPPQAATEAQIRAEGARRLRLIASAYTDEERETWATQVDEANALAADPEADVPLIAALAAADGVTVAQMAGFIMANKTAFTAASAAVLAVQRTLIAMDPRPVDCTADALWDPSE